jgi:hypothetical protein
MDLIPSSSIHRFVGKMLSYTHKISQNHLAIVAHETTDKVADCARNLLLTGQMRYFTIMVQSGQAGSSNCHTLKSARTLSS